MVKCILFIILFLSAVRGHTQPVSFTKTVWEIDSFDDNGTAYLHRINRDRHIQSYPKKSYNYLEFLDTKEFYKGIGCYGEGGHYRLEGNNRIVFTGMGIAMSADCRDPESISGSYTYLASGNRLQLSVSNADEPELYEEKAAGLSLEAMTQDPLPVIPYQKLRNWVRDRFDRAFFEKYGYYDGIKIALILRFDDQGRTFVEDIENTSDKKLVQAISEVIARMPVWTKEEVAYSSLQRVPMLYIAEQ